MSLSTTIPICEGIVRLFDPFVEVVIHDLSLGTICYIRGNLSKRRIGDPSLLEPDELEKDIDKIVYPKINFDGRLIKSISIPLEERWLLCINADVSVFSQMKTLSELFLNPPGMEQPESLFKNDWQEKLHKAIHTFLQQQEWKFETLTGRQKKETVKYLFECGAFEEKNAADYIANVLHLGRATVFKYLKEWRNS